jgi:HAMP domain-containing protein
MPAAGSGMPIRLRLAVAFAVIAAVFFALGGWLFASGLSSDEAIQGQVARELAVGGAVFVAVAGLGAYRLARAALSPVERLRRQVAAISAGDEASRVEVPRTRDEVAALAGTMNELLARPQPGAPGVAGMVSGMPGVCRTGPRRR